MLNVFLKSTLLTVFTTLSVSAAHAVCISSPKQILSAPQIRVRMDNMGGYNSLMGTYLGKLKKGIVSVPIRIHIIHQENRFFLRMEWKEVFTKKHAEHAFNVCANQGTGANALYLVMHRTPFGPGTPYGLPGLRHFKVVGHTAETMTLDLSPDELSPRFAETNLVIRNIRKVQ